MTEGGRETNERCHDCRSGKCSLRVAGTLLAERVSKQAFRFEVGDFSDDAVMQSLYLVVEYLKIYIEGVHQVERYLADEAHGLPDEMRHALANPHEYGSAPRIEYAEYAERAEQRERFDRMEFVEYAQHESIGEPKDWRAKLAEWHRLNG